MSTVWCKNCREELIEFRGRWFHVHEVESLATRFGKAFQIEMATENSSPLIKNCRKPEPEKKARK